MIVGGLYVAAFGGGLLKFGRCGAFDRRMMQLAGLTGASPTSAVWVGVIAGCASEAERSLLNEASNRFAKAHAREWFVGDFSAALPVLCDVSSRAGIKNHRFLTSVRHCGDMSESLMRQVRDQVVVAL